MRSGLIWSTLSRPMISLPRGLRIHPHPRQRSVCPATNFGLRASGPRWAARLRIRRTLPPPGSSRPMLRRAPRVMARSDSAPPIRLPFFRSRLEIWRVRRRSRAKQFVWRRTGTRLICFAASFSGTWGEIRNRHRKPISAPAWAGANHNLPGAYFWDNSGVGPRLLFLAAALSIVLPAQSSLTPGTALDVQGKGAEARAFFQKAIDSAASPAAKAEAERAMAMSWAFESNCAKTVEYEQMVIDYWATKEASQPGNAFYQEGEM